VNTVVHEIYGQTVYNFKNNTMTCWIKLQQSNLLGESVICFHVQVFRSREFKNGSTCKKNDNKKNTETIYVVRFRRLEGDVLAWKKILNQVIYTKCSTVLTGLPQWASRQLRKLNASEAEQYCHDDLLVKEGVEF